MNSPFSFQNREFPSWMKMKVMRTCINIAAREPENDELVRKALNTLKLSARQQAKCLSILHERLENPRFRPITACSFHDEALKLFAKKQAKEEYRASYQPIDKCEFDLEDSFSEIEPIKDPALIPSVVPIAVKSLSKENGLRFCFDCLKLNRQELLDPLLKALKGTEIYYDFCRSLIVYDLDEEGFFRRLPDLELTSEQAFLIVNNLLVFKRNDTSHAEFYLVLCKLNLTSHQFFKLFKRAIKIVDDAEIAKLVEIAWQTPLDEVDKVTLLKKALHRHRKSNPLAPLFDLLQQDFLSIKEKEMFYLEWAKSGNFFPIYYSHTVFLDLMKMICKEFSPDFHLKLLVTLFTYSSWEHLLFYSKNHLWSYPELANQKRNAFELLHWMPNCSTDNISLLNT